MKKTPKTNLSALLIFLLTIISIFATKALFRDGFFTSHDGHHQLIRQAVFHQGLVDGQLPVRWAGNSLHGSGYPLFIFTYRLPFWVGQIFYILVNNLSLAVKLSFAFSFVASGLTMYWFLAILTNRKLTAFFGSLIYQFAPYRFVDIFVRAALGEAFCFIFMPLVFLAIYQISSKNHKRKWIILLALSFASLILSHIMTFVLFTPAILIWLIYNMFFTKDKKKYFLAIVFASLFSVALTSYYWHPAFSERSLTIFNSVIGSYYQDHFLSFRQLIYSKWGYGFSNPIGQEDHMSFQIGIAQWLIIGFSVFYLLIFFLISRQSKNKIKKIFTLSFEKVALFLVLLILLVFSIFMMLPYSAYVYQLLNKLVVIDLPWKFLSVIIFIVPIIYSIFIESINHQTLKFIFIFITISLAIYSNRNHLNINQTIYYSDSDLFSSHDTSNQHSDYAPAWFIPIQDKLIDDKIKTKHYLLINGQADISLDKLKSNQISFTANIFSNNAKILINKTRYPGWKLFINQQPHEINNDMWGRIAITLNKGSQDVELKFKETLSRKISNFISASSLLLIIILYIWPQKLIRQK